MRIKLVLTESKQSDYSRSQYTEKYIQDRVAVELKKLEAETIKKFQETTNGALLKEESNPELSVPKANEKIGELTKKLQENIELAKVEINQQVKSSREGVIKCLKENLGKSLNCWEEVENFKKLVADLQNLRI